MATEWLMRDYYDINGNLVQRSIYQPHRRQYLQSNSIEKSCCQKEPSGRDALAVSRQRAFSLASLKVLCNPDMTVFLTLTYDPKKNSAPDYLSDLKNLFRGTGTKYVATFERHKQNNPLLHIHIICTPTIPLELNENGYLHCPKWHRGFSSAKMLDEFDDQFRASKYVFKYMLKSEKVMHKYVYSSRALVPTPVVREIRQQRVDVIKYMQGLNFILGEMNRKFKVVKGISNVGTNERFKINSRTLCRETVEQKWKRVLCLRGKRRRLQKGCVPRRLGESVSLEQCLWGSLS